MNARAAAVLVVLSILGGLLAPESGRAAEPIPITVEEAVEAALTRSPELLEYLDAAAQASLSLAGVRSLYRPQLAPFYQRTLDRDGETNRSRFGIAASQQLTFGPRLAGSVEALSGPTGYTSTYSLSLEQPLARGADPAVTREPLRLAERSVETQYRNLETFRRQTVVTAWSACLNQTLSRELLLVAREGESRAERIRAASEAKLSAGTVSRLDVLRAEQLVASARSYANETQASHDDAQETLARLTGRPVGTRFEVTLPAGLPVSVPGEEEAVAHGRAHREDVVEALERARDAAFALRIATSNVLPLVTGFAGWSASGEETGIFGSLTSPGRSRWSLGIRTEAPLNTGLLGSQRRQAEVSLAQARRRAALLADDVERAIRQSARRLRTARERLAIDEANLEVARAQLEVANLRFEKGLSDNFHVIDAENLYNGARVSAVTARNALLLASLDLLSVSGLLRPEDFRPRSR